MSVTVRPSDPSDLEFAVAELGAAGLPVADLRGDHLVYTAVTGDTVVGVIGFEAYGDVGLLRSLVVSRASRGSGVGRRLVASLEEGVTLTGTREIWLLTIDADAWFSKYGYVARERREAPPAIQGTAEFSDLCPGDAVLMSKTL